MIRLIIEILFLIVFATIGQIFYLIILLIGFFNTKIKDILLLKYVKIVSHIILFITGIDLYLDGKQNIKTNETYLYIANHRSELDTLLAYTIVKAPTGFIAKKEISKVPILNSWNKQLHGLFINRGNIREEFKTIINAIETVKKGISIWIFAEGTRCKNENPLDMLPFKEGSFEVAKKTGCKIIPVAMYKTDDLFEKHFPKVKKAKVYVQIGEAIDINELKIEDKKNIGKYTREIILDMLKKLKEMDS
ncbi:MAG: lysophospholipid acyltransferase family protein [Eubacteriales bacterium]|nr:lysophospholipid acyltransferase family protein [Eubacteriales bacterium]